MVELLPGRRLGTYQILSQLGAGGMGEVYRAKDLKLGREVAIKVLPERFTADPNRLARFKREARVLAALNHPRIAAIYGLEDAGESFVPGARARRRRNAGPSHRARAADESDESLAIALQIGEAVEAAHAKGIVHRDLKPSNVILQRAARQRIRAIGGLCCSPAASDSIAVKVLDFGLAKASAALSESPTVTADGTGQAVIMGTTPYTSPEQARANRGPRLPHRHLVARGRALSNGRRRDCPLQSGEAHAVLYSIIHSPHEPLTAVRTDVPTELDRIVGKSLSKNPGERYQHVDDLLVDLRTLEKQWKARPRRRRPRF